MFGGFPTDMTIRCITFDLDDTLWETGPVIARAEQIALDWMKDNAPDVIADRSEQELLEHRRAHYATLPHFSHDFTALRRHWLETLFVEVGRSKSMAREAFDVFWQARNDVTPFEDAMAAIARLNAEGLYIGTITNGNASIEHIGLGEHFHFTVTAADAGVMKPAAEIFAYALNKVGVHPSEAIHVGDDPVSDVVGARDFGMKTVWVNPQRKLWDESLGRAPDVQVDSSAEIEAVVARWR